MREYKAKRVDNGEWVEGFLYHPFGGICYIMQPNNIYIEVDPETVGQYTGKIDKDDNKIYTI